MPNLTRRRYPERPDCWHVYYGDVRVGVIAMRVGNPFDTDPWEWICGFYPGCEPGEHQNATAATFDQARAEFDVAWQHLLPKRTEADFQAWRYQRAATAWKYAMHDRGLPLPTQRSNGRSRCFCGAEIDIKGTDPHIREAHMTDLQPHETH
jgi:hypothetical protein